ncbi:S-DNA-T family DNA segregation ATPase FtsK/SpoIIIE [Mycobacterium sp. BK086]|uniref:FtsK/SpoIIIE domain-containing protein n=1 Tax=Mycobacterium sp. BK086 TaxID=2512165 RepID=UPI00105DD878|nr:FtsK/SpoIIIE domain-containing protein [Mycobacterium sp. BK086]TDO10461.1 S-DNA-T family DNA segregation ATPase FtsK/SpoIIIE [Mycobacterium sp. BK086]
MHLKLILRRTDGTRAQVAVTADATASVSDLATALVTGDPDRGGARPRSSLTLKLEHTAFDTGAPGRVLDPARSLIESGIRSGSTVSVTPAGMVAQRTRRGRSVAVLRILEGPDVGREFSLAPGNSVIGTGLASDVMLTDPGIAGVHAAVTVGESIEIANLAGPTGVLLAGQPVQRTLVGVTDVVRLGNTSVAILPTVRPGTVQTDSVAIEFNRSPRVVPQLPERIFTAPRPPQRFEPPHLPILSMLLPLLLGLGLLLVSRNLLSVLFIALSPLLMIGMYIDTQWQARKKRRQEIARFAESLRQLASDLTAAQRVERAVRCTETPALAEVVEAIHRLGPLLWTHRPEHREFLVLRVGLGDAPSRCRIDTSNEYDAEPEYAQQIGELRDQFDHVADVPVVADLRECGSLGVCGPRAVVDGVARGIVMQLVGLHSPAELTISAFCSPASRTSWEWLEWLPHNGSLHSPLSGNHLTDSANGGLALLARLEDLVKTRAAENEYSTDHTFAAIDDQDRLSADARPPLVLPAVVVLVDDTAPIDRARLTRLAERGPAVGVHLIWVATQVTSLPASCRSFVLIENETSGSTIGEVRHGRHTYPVACDSLDVADAKQIALLLAPVIDVGAAVEDTTDLPRSVNYLSLSGTGLAAEPTAVARQWLANDSVANRTGQAASPAAQTATLRALVGSTGLQDFYLDLREHGPHALVGGTTGSGKSEFLQTWVLGMATAHSPDRVNFLFVDYKGGTAFADCVDLPHTVGLVTDLSPHLVRRALTSLRAEIRHREKLLNLKRAKDLASLERTGDPDTPPSLVIVVDEFAALATEVPEFVDGVIDVAQRGRSLGLHLILATQRPAGVIRDNLRANTNLRIALRLNDVDDSLDVIDDPLAAHFPLEIPGRVVAKTGPGRLTTFQAGYVGGWSSDQPDRAPIDISEFVFGRRRPWNTEAPAATGLTTGSPTDIARMVATTRAAAEGLRIRPPRKPWLPPLQSSYALESMTPHVSGARLVIGRADLPTDQTQPIGVFAPDDDGNMAILGTGGSGKSTALCTLAIAAALSPDDGPVHVYAFDFASGSLRILEPLPHVAAVVSGDDDERIGRVLRRLTAVLDQRSRSFTQVNAATITDYRHITGHDEPRIMLLVDGIGSFREAYEHVSGSPIFPMFSQLTSDGRRLGIHVVVSGDRPGSLSIGLASAIPRRLVLRLASDDDYSIAGIRDDILSSSSPRGRGVMDGQELHVAVLGGNANVAMQAEAIEVLAADQRASDYPEPQPVERLSDHIALETLPPRTGDNMPAIGVADETLAPIGVHPRGVLMVTGPPGSGRRSALVTLAQAIRRDDPSAYIVHLAPATTSISGLTVWNRSATGTDAVRQAADDLMAAVSTTTAPAALTVVIESVTDFSGTDVESTLTQLVKTLSDASAFVVGEAEVSTWSQAWQLGQPFKSPRRGLLLAPSAGDSDTLLNTSIGPVRRHEFPPGRGVLIEKGRGVWLQLAQPDL